MKTTIKALAIVAVSTIATIEASAQKIAAAAIVDQHYAAETNNYKFMMYCLAAAFAGYVILQVRRNRELNRFLGKK